MSGTMSSADLAADLKASLHDAGEVFTAAGGADFVRLLDMALLDMARVRTRTLLGSVTLVAGQMAYALPADLFLYKADLWADPSRIGPPWAKTWPGRLPSVRIAWAGGTRQLLLNPPPTAQQIALLGDAFNFYYLAKHALGADEADTTLQAGDRGLLLLRAQAEAMRELAMRNIAKPMSIRDGLNSAPKNGTPAALYSALLQEFERATAC